MLPRHAEAAFVAAPSIPILNQQLVIVGETDAEAKKMLDSYLEYADPTGALVLMSGWTGIDFAALDPNEILSYQESNALASVVSAFTEADPDKQWTVRKIADYARLGGDGPVIWGSPESVADQLEEWVEETGVDGFNLAAAVLPETFSSIAHLLVPELQKRGRFKKEYRSGSLQAKLSGGSDSVDSAHASGLVRAAEWNSARG